MFYLASRSPRRRALLTQVGVAFTPLDVDVPERPGPDETPADYVTRVARAKAHAGWARAAGDDPHAVVLGADTEVVLDGRIFGKPVDADSAAEMLRALSGRTHRVLSVVCGMAAGVERVAACASSVRFAALDEGVIAAYVATGEPFGKAGGYAIQGRAAAFVAHLEGSYSGVMGLPLFETLRLLQALGVRPARN